MTISTLVTASIFQPKGFEKGLRLRDRHVHLPIRGDDFFAHDDTEEVVV